MDRWILGDAVRQRHKALLDDAQRARLVAQWHRAQRRLGARARLARALRAAGYALVDAGHSLEPESWRSA